MGQKITIGQARELTLLSGVRNCYTKAGYEKMVKEILDREIGKCLHCGTLIEIKKKENNKKFTRFEIMDI